MDDEGVLEFAANEGRIILTHDVSTMTHFAYERAKDGQAMPGVFEVSTSQSLAVAIEEILIIAK